MQVKSRLAPLRSASAFSTPVISSMAMFQELTRRESSKVATPKGMLSMMFSLNSFSNASCRFASARSWRDSRRFVEMRRTDSESRACSPGESTPFS